MTSMAALAVTTEASGESERCADRRSRLSPCRMQHRCGAHRKASRPPVSASFVVVVVAICALWISLGVAADNSQTQKLFDEPYRPGDSRHFRVQSSSTFTPDTEKQFDLAYADGTELKGFNAKDIVQLGNFHGMAPFGIITDCNSPDFNGVDGILGFGLPKPGMEGRDLPTPILWALTNKHEADSNAQELTRKFSFFSTDTAAELQLGGYDPATCTDLMQYTPSLSSTDFIVGVTSLTYGHPGRSDHVELLKFTNPSGGEYLPAIMDSGTSCLVIPGDRLGGKLSNNPFDDFTDLWDEGTSFWVTVGGKTFEIPFHSWYLAETNQTCVQPSPAGMQGLLIGDVFFREYMVEFDMADELRPIIGIAKLNKQYAPVGSNELGYFKLQQAPRQKLQLLKGEETMYPAEHSTRLDEVDQIPIFNKKGTQYFMDLAIGTPKQPFTVIFDTGSAVFGVFTIKHSLPENIKHALARSSAFSQTTHFDPMNTLIQWDFASGGMPHGATLEQSAPGQGAVISAAATELLQTEAAPEEGRGSFSVAASVASGLVLMGVVGGVAVVLSALSRAAGRRRCQRQQWVVLSSEEYGAVATTSEQVAA